MCRRHDVLSLDEINQSLSVTHDNVLHDDNPKTYGEIKSSIRRNIEMARTILSCGEHQKRIINDTRATSKLDFNLLSISPIASEPLQIVNKAIMMFSWESSKLDINIQLEVDPSIESLELNSLFFDSPRFLQLLLNLLTNATKFSKSLSTRNAIVHLGATISTPYHREIGREIQYIPLRTARKDPTSALASGTGEIVYLHCSVTDTSGGMSERERSDLFMKISQASPSTHTQYGDPDLGLFVCRELAELQGGAIGIGYSDPTVTGNTFAFYIKTRRSDIGAGGSELPLKAQVRLSHLERGNAETLGSDIGCELDEFSLSDLDVKEHAGVNDGSACERGVEQASLRDWGVGGKF